MPIALSKRQAYWSCQLFGWSAFVAYEIVNQVGLGMFSWYNALLMVLVVPLGIGLTHLYRAILLRWRVLELPFVRMALLAFAAVFALSAVLFLGLGLVGTLMSGGVVNWAGITLNYVFMSILNWSRYVFVWVLIYHLYGLMERVNRAQIERLSYENQLKNVELQHLKAQINPHFLFNALNSVKALTHSNPKRAGEAVVLLSDLLRYSLNYERHTLIPLRDEIAVTRDYLELEKIRFNQRLEYSLEIAPEAEGWLIPPIVLVTLTENAIKHGIAQSVEGGKVAIRAKVENRQLLLSVCNTGRYAPTPGREGIGLANIRRRLDVLYAGNARFDLQYLPETETVTAFVCLPER